MPTKSTSVDPFLTVSCGCHYFDQDMPKSENIESKAYGIAYEIKLDNMETTFEHLNFREKFWLSYGEW